MKYLVTVAMAFILAALAWWQFSGNSVQEDAELEKDGPPLEQEVQVEAPAQSKDKADFTATTDYEIGQQEDGVHYESDAEREAFQKELNKLKQEMANTERRAEERSILFGDYPEERGYKNYSLDTLKELMLQDDAVAATAYCDKVYYAVLGDDSGSYEVNRKKLQEACFQAASHGSSRSGHDLAGLTLGDYAETQDKNLMYSALAWYELAVMRGDYLSITTLGRRLNELREILGLELASSEYKAVEQYALQHLKKINRYRHSLGLGDLPFYESREEALSYLNLYEGKRDRGDPRFQYDWIFYLQKKYDSTADAANMTAN